MTPWLEEWLKQPPVQALITRGKQTGALTFDEVNAALPNVIDPDQLAALCELFDRNGISLLDGDEPDPLPEEPLPEPPDSDPIYHRDAVFEKQLRAIGVPFSDVMCSYDPNTGLVFDAELIVPGEQVLEAWLALRNAVPLTGLCPVIRGERNEATYENDQPHQLDPRGRLDAMWREVVRTRSGAFPRLTPDVIRADAAVTIVEAEKVPPTPWRFGEHRGEPPVIEGPDAPFAPSEPNCAELFSNAGPFRAHYQGGGHPDYPTFPFMRVRLYPTTTPWEVFAYSPYCAGNDCPGPLEQLSLHRYWHGLYGTELVSVPGAWYELFVPRPPRTRHQALRLLHEMGRFGDETIFGYQPRPENDLIEQLRTSHFWYFWWD